MGGHPRIRIRYQDAPAPAQPGRAPRRPAPSPPAPRGVPAGAPQQARTDRPARGTARGTPRPAPRPRGAIALVARSGSDWELALYDAELDRLEPLTSAGAATPVTRPAVSPDGSLVAYFAADGTVRLRSLARSRPRERVVAEPGGPVGLAWSPDGRFLALDGIRIVDVATGASAQVADGGRWPQWLPPGDRLVFARELHIWQLDLPARRLTRLTRDPPAPRAALRASPDGRYLAYASPDAPRSRLRVLMLAGGGEHEVETLGASELEPCWCASPCLLAFVALEPSPPGDGLPGARVRVAEPAGTVLRDVARLATPLGGPLAWSPDGRFLAAVDADARGRHVVLLAVDGPVRQRIGGADEAVSPCWFAKPAIMSQS